VPAFRYDTSGAWYKGNAHIHSTASDGGKTFPELAQMYAGEGYDFLVRTDHWVASDAEADAEEYPLVWLDGSVLTEAAFELPEDWPYAYLEIEDAERRRAWTNPLFIADADGSPA